MAGKRGTGRQRRGLPLLNGTQGDTVPIRFVWFVVDSFRLPASRTALASELAAPIRILLQTTIPDWMDDWHIGRFSMLQHHLQGLVDEDGGQLCRIEARDRAVVGFPDPILANLDRYAFDQLWLFAVDEGDGLEVEDCEGITRFRKGGGGLLVTRDHMDLGSSVGGLGDIGAAHFFHSRNHDPDPCRRRNDDIETPEIGWPNYHSGANGDFQEIRVEGPPHPTLLDPASPTGLIRYLPSHPHEGAVGAPPDDASARIIATGTSKVTGHRFNLAVAFEPSSSAGPAIAHSTFHHFADLNWDPSSGSPPFVTEQPGHGLASSAPAQASTRRYVTNLAHWLSGRDPPGLAQG